MAARHCNRNGYPGKGHTFDPTFHADKIDQILNLKGKRKRIFLDSMSDWWSPGVDSRWVRAIIEAVSQKPEHTFLVLTKFPQYIDRSEFPENLWLGVSVTCNAENWRIRKLLDYVSEDVHKFASFEPLHGSITYDLSELEWIIVGAESGNRPGKVEPKEEWVKSIFNCWPDDKPIPIYMKDNLMPYLPEWGQIKVFPEGI